MVQKILFSILLLTMMTTGMWGQKKELSQARTYIKSGKDYDKAEKLMKDLVKNPENRTNAKIYATWYDAVAGQYAQANEKLYLKQAYDTAAFFNITQRMYRVAETLDSLGRVVRQSQKVTDRTLSRQEQQRIDRLEQTFEQQIHRAIEEHDSLWQERFAHYQATMTDSLQSIRDLRQQTAASNPLTWWQQLQQWLGRLVLIAIAVVAGWWIVKKRVWLRLIK